MFRKKLLCLLAGWLLALPLVAAPTPFLLLDPAALATYRTAYQAHHEPEATQVRQVLAAADQALAGKAYSVVFKPHPAPSGDPHDYASQAIYFWPDPKQPTGRPYISRDGLVNPEAATLRDHDELFRLCREVKLLALAYYFTGQERYAAVAATRLRVFFLAPATRMNPNLNCAQGVPGLVAGRSYGIIDSRVLVEIPDALALFGGSKSVDAALVSGLRAWMQQFVSWLTTSKLGLEEAAATNNHGTFYDGQVVDLALFAGDSALARHVLTQQTLARIPQQFEPDGAQPLELARTRPWNYVTMNLQGWVRLAILAERLHLDLWHYTTPDGRGLPTAIAWVRPYLLGERQMAKTDVAPTSNAEVLAAYAQAAPHYPGLAGPVVARYPDFTPVPWNF